VLILDPLDLTSYILLIILLTDRRITVAILIKLSWDIFKMNTLYPRIHPIDICIHPIAIYFGITKYIGNAVMTLIPPNHILNICNRKQWCTFGCTELQY